MWPTNPIFRATRHAESSQSCTSGEVSTAGRPPGCVVWWLADGDERDVMKEFGLFNGTDLGEQVERVSEEGKKGSYCQ